MTDEITLHMDDIRHLFNAPEFDPFSPNARSASGIDTIIESLKPRQLTRSLRAVVVLPAPQVTPDLPDQVRAAVARFTQQKIDEMDHELASLRWRGLKALQSGLILLAVCLLLATLTDQAEFLPDRLRTFLGEGLTIVGWVSLWHPAETLLFDWWSPWREKRLYRFIKTMDFDVKGD